MAAFRMAIGLLLFATCAVSFAPAPLTRSGFQGTPLVVSKPSPPGRQQQQRRRPRATSLSMFLGSDGGFLGVGAPEVFTILLVGYFVLGPSDLYKLVKELGKGITNLRTLSADVTKTFETNMESQLQLEDLRKAQRELNDAFSFRRSINVDEEVAFNEISTTSATETTAAAAAASTETTSSATEGSADNPKKKKKKRVKKKKVVQPEMDNFEPNVLPDLEMPPLDDTLIREEEERAVQHEEEEERMRRRERTKSLQSDTAQLLPEEQEQFGLPSTEQSPEEQERFARQLSGNWNDMILANEDKLSPLSKIMERLAILEEEKKAADARLEEEFRLRTGVEEKYYREKRAILEEAAAEVQAKAYVSLDENKTTV